MEVGIGLIVLLVIFNYMAWRSNIESNLSWERMRRSLTPTDYRSAIEQSMYPVITRDVKTFYSNRLLDRLVPSMNHAKAFDDGYFHAIQRRIDKLENPFIFEVPQ